MQPRARQDEAVPTGPKGPGGLLVLLPVELLLLRSSQCGYCMLS